MELYEKTYLSDVYIMIPYCDKGSCKSGEDFPKTDEFAKKYIEAINSISAYECSSTIANNLKRRFLGKLCLGCMTDDYDEEICGEETTYLFLTSHKNTGLHVLTLLIPDSQTSPTQLEDQMSANNLLIRNGGSGKKADSNFQNYQNIDIYMENKYGLRRCGNAKCVLCLSQKPRDHFELYYMLAAEAYNSVHFQYRIQSRSIEEISKNNIAQYDFYEAYVSSSCLVYILKNFSKNFFDNIVDEGEAIFICELVLFQNMAITRTNQKIVDELSRNRKTSLRAVEILYEEFGQTIEFWKYDNFKYKLAQNFADNINKAYKTADILANYYRNQNYLEHIVELKGTQVSEKEGKILNIIAIILAVIQVIPIIGEFDSWIKAGKLLHNQAFFPLGIGACLTLFFILIIRKRIAKRFNKKG